MKTYKIELTEDELIHVRTLLKFDYCGNPNSIAQAIFEKLRAATAFNVGAARRRNVSVQGNMSVQELKRRNGLK
jgi:hypothetical protein